MTTTVLSMRDLFELHWSDRNDIPLHSVESYRLGDTYRLPGIAKDYRYFVAGWYAAQSAPDTDEQGKQS